MYALVMSPWIADREAIARAGKAMTSVLGMPITDAESFFHFHDFEIRRVVPKEIGDSSPEPMMLLGTFRKMPGVGFGRTRVVEVRAYLSDGENSAVTRLVVTRDGVRQPPL